MIQAPCSGAANHALRYPLTEVSTRYDKLAANYLASVQLASIRVALRVKEFKP